MLTGKQKRYLRSLAVTMDPVVQVGKGAIGENLLKQVDETLEARELIKIRVLKNCMDEIDEVAEGLAASCGAEVAQIIGSIILLYRPSKKNPEIKLP